MPEWIAALGALASMVGVLLVWWQVRLTRKTAQDAFEDGLAREYRELASRIPTKALIGSRLSPNEYKRAFDELFRYIDLSNEQIVLRAHRRVSDRTWEQWSDGIKFNMGLPAFIKAWADIHSKAPNQFSELDRFLSGKHAPDPRNWTVERGK